MKSILNIFQIWYREIGNIFRDKGIMIFILFVPLAYPLLYSYVYTNEREFGITQDPTAGLQMDIDYRAIRRVA